MKGCQAARREGHLGQHRGPRGAHAAAAGNERCVERDVQRQHDQRQPGRRPPEVARDQKMRQPVVQVNERQARGQHPERRLRPSEAGTEEDAHEEPRSKEGHRARAHAKGEERREDVPLDPALQRGVPVGPRQPGKATERTIDGTIIVPRTP